LHDQFTRSHASGVLPSPDRSAVSLIARLGSGAADQVWDVADDLS
jgi:hypothetical protein